MKISIQSDDVNADALLYEMSIWLRARGFDVEIPPMPVATESAPAVVVKQGNEQPRSVGPHLPTMSNALRDALKQEQTPITFAREPAEAVK